MLSKELFMSKKWLLPYLLLLALTSFAQDKTAQPPDAQWPLPKLNHFDVGIIDTKVDPCDNFYKYACSKWQAANPIPADQPVWSTGSNLELYNQTILRNALQAASVAKNRDAVHQKIGDYWASCMDEAAIDKKGIKAIQPDLDRIAALKSKSELPAALAAFHNSYPASWLGNDNETSTAVFGYGPSVDYKDATLVVGGFDQAGMSMGGRDYYLSDDAKMVEMRKKFVAHVQKMFELAGENPQQAQADHGPADGNRHGQGCYGQREAP
jgi:endothelin-converting enzyme/putative endopeptidase